MVVCWKVVDLSTSQKNLKREMTDEMENNMNEK